VNNYIVITISSLIVACVIGLAIGLTYVMYSQVKRIKGENRTLKAEIRSLKKNNAILERNNKELQRQINYIDASILFANELKNQL
jgi:cell division protein FtsB